MDSLQKNSVTLYATFLVSFLVGGMALLFLAGSLGRPVFLVGFNIAQLFSSQPTDATSLFDLPWVLYLVISAVVFLLPVLLRKWWSMVAFLALLMWILFGFCNQGLLFDGCQGGDGLEGASQFVIFALYISSSYFLMWLTLARRLFGSEWMRWIIMGLIPVLLAPVVSIVGISFLLGLSFVQLGWIFAGLNLIWFAMLLIQDLREKKVSTV